MQYEQIVHQHLQGQLCTDVREATARKTTQASMLFQVRKHDFDRLTYLPSCFEQSIPYNPLGSLGL